MKKEYDYDKTTRKKIGTLYGKPIVIKSYLKVHRDGSDLITDYYYAGKKIELWQHEKKKKLDQLLRKEIGDLFYKKVKARNLDREGIYLPRIFMEKNIVYLALKNQISFEKVFDKLYEAVKNKCSKGAKEKRNLVDLCIDQTFENMITFTAQEGEFRDIIDKKEKKTVEELIDTKNSLYNYLGVLEKT